MEHIIENEELRVITRNYGAEVVSVKDKKTGREYYKSGEETGLPMVLFPNTARIKEDTMYAGGQKYEIPLSGFAKSVEFNVYEKTDSSVTFWMRDDEETLKMYPYAFVLKIQYTLEGRTLRVEGTVENPTDADLYFELGFHPAYCCNNAEEAHTISFAEPCTAGRMIRPGLLTTHIEPDFFKETKEAAVEEAFFSTGTVVLTDADCRKVSLNGEKSGTLLTVDGSSFKNICFYAPYDRPVEYVCIELWNSDPEYADTDQVWEHKKGIHKVTPHETCSAEWTLTIE